LTLAFITIFLSTLGTAKIGNNLQGSSHDLNGGTMTAYTWTGWGKP